MTTKTTTLCYDDINLKSDVADQEVHARTKHPHDEHDRHHLDDTNVTVPPNDVQQLQQLRCVEQADESQELQTFTMKTQHSNITNYDHNDSFCRNGRNHTDTIDKKITH